ncbi:MAG TPA: hypothetical protein VMV25_08360 [Steroidobacteraceae bacterium]|nr:hypothetical protein [Steroidobacteraceae bacterium]
MRSASVAAPVALVCLLAGCGGSSNGGGMISVNGGVHVPAGRPTNAIATVNGSILADGYAIMKSARTVNGNITIGAHATAESLSTVNGAITLQPDARVSGTVTIVNGNVTLQDGASVSGMVTNVNGIVTLYSAHVTGGISTVDADISVLGNSVVEGGITVKRPSGLFFHISDAVPRIVIGPGAVVQGELRFRHKVALYVSDKATIGAVSGATAVPFSGPVPPA